MIDFSNYYRQLTALIEKKEPVWQAIIMLTDGSTPATCGMHLTVAAKGTVFGNLGGGNLEHQVIEYIMYSKPDKPEVRRYNLNDDQVSLTEPTVSDSECYETGMVCGGSVTVYIEPLFSAYNLYIIGGGHCGKALADIAKNCNFSVTVIDNRDEQFRELSELSDVATIVCDYEDLDKHLRFSADSYIVIMTYGHKFDEFVLEKCLRQPYRYLGMIGSKKKVAQTMDRLKEKGYTQKELERVAAPVGLPIGSRTPYEIAVSVTAELIKVRSDLG